MISVPQDRLKELLDYCPRTGVFTWIGHKNTQAGWIDYSKNGYPRRRIEVDGRAYTAARLAFIWMGEDPPERVDHEDRESLNNTWSNLKRSCQKENAKNKSRYRTNSSGVSGVHWCKSKKKWIGRVGLNGERVHLGVFEEKENAIE